VNLNKKILDYGALVYNANGALYQSLDVLKACIHQAFEYIHVFFLSIFLTDLVNDDDLYI